MVRLNEIRHRELDVTSLPRPTGAGLIYIGRIHTPWTHRLQCPHQGLDGTPLIDLKPDRTLFTPIAPRQAGDDQTEQAS